MEVDNGAINYIIGSYARLVTLKDRKAFYEREVLKHREVYEPNNIQAMQAMAIEESKLIDNIGPPSSLDPQYSKLRKSFALYIIEEYVDKIFFNLCPKCSQLARTPLARQCRYCHHHWH